MTLTVKSLLRRSCAEFCHANLNLTNKLKVNLHLQTTYFLLNFLLKNIYSYVGNCSLDIALNAFAAACFRSSGGPVDSMWPGHVALLRKAGASRTVCSGLSRPSRLHRPATYRSETLKKLCYPFDN